MSSQSNEHDRWLRDLIAQSEWDEMPDAVNMEQLERRLLHERATAPPHPVLTRLPRFTSARAATAATLLLAVVATWFLAGNGQGPANGWAVAQSIAALQCVHSVHLKGIDADGAPFECWIEPKNAGAALGRLRFESTNLIAVVEDDRVTAYLPERNELHLYSGEIEPGIKAWRLAMKLRPWIGDTLLQELQAHADYWQEESGADEQGRKCVFVSCSFDPLGMSFWFAFDLESKLVVGGKQWSNTDLSGTPQYEVCSVEYNIPLADGLFAIETPTDVSVLDASAQEEGKTLFEEAEALYRAKRYSDAIEMYLEVYDRFPEWNYAESALMMVGICNDDLGDSDEAIRWYQRAIREYPGLRGWSEATHYYLGAQYARRGERDLALEHFHMCIELCRGVRQPEAFPWKQAREALEKLEQDG